MEETDELEGQTSIEIPAPAGYDLKALGEMGADAYYEAIQNAANGTARSAQAQDHRMGVSNLGHCRQYAKLLIEQTPFSDVRDKTAAFFGTVAGDAIEAQLFKDHPGWIIQDECEFPFTDGDTTRTLPGHCDVVIPASEGVSYEEYMASREEGYEGPKLYMQGVWDGKSKAELESIRKYGPTQQQVFQIHAYTKAQIAKGNLDPTKPIVIMDVYFDRSGRDVKPYGVAHIYTEDVVTFIEQWMGDVLYAVRNQEDASRDMPRDWCHKYCEYATICRGLDTDVTGLIEDPEVVQKIELYRDAQQKETEAKNQKKLLAKDLVGIEGSTGKHVIKQLWVDGGEVAYYRKGAYRLDIRDVPKGK